MIFFTKSLCSLSLIFLFFSCASTNSGTEKSDKPKSTFQPTTVQEYLRTIPGVSVSGNRVTVANGQPLYIVNGNNMSYETLVRTVPVSRIKSARLSKSATDLKVYTNSAIYTSIIFIITE